MPTARPTPEPFRPWLRGTATLACALLVVGWYALRDESKPPRDPSDRAFDGGLAPAKAVTTSRARHTSAKPPKKHQAMDAAPTGGLAAIRLGQVFDEQCVFGVEANCEEWRRLATACDEGRAHECARLGDLLLFSPPMQPVFATLFLRKACDLGLDDQCERALRWREWSQYGYVGEASLETGAPEGLVAACEAEEMTACGLIVMRGASDGVVDEDLARRTCKAGFRDVCLMVTEGAPTSEALVEILRLGCEIPDAQICQRLGAIFGGDCDAETLPCPPADPEEAQRYRQRACELQKDLCD